MADRLRAAIYFSDTEQPWCREWKRALLEGIRAAGDRADLVDPLAAEPEADLTVTWGLNAGRMGLMQRQHERGGRHLVMERGYVGDRERWTSLGFDGLNGRALFPAVADGGARWRKHFDGLLKPWQRPGAYALLLGQIPTDTAVRHMDFAVWADGVANDLAGRGWAVRYRPHPAVRQSGDSWHPTVAALSKGSLDEDLAGASFALSYNSNSGVDALLGGVPGIVMDEGAMAWKASHHAIDDLNCATEMSREAWARWLAWTQWRMDEIASGAAWETVRTCLGH